MSDTYYPPSAFYFTVHVLGSGTLFSLLTDIDASFEEVSGIEAEFGIDPVVEGGENRFTHKLPKAAKYQNLVLKRGVVTEDSVLAEWVGQTVGSGMSLPILPQNLLVTLLNESGNPVIVWGFINAYPVKWKTAPMNSLENKVLTESMEFSYNYFERLNLGSGLSAAVKLAQFAARLA